MSIHIPVLLHEVLEGLTPVAGMTYLDGTLGGAGHALAMARAVKGDCTVIGLDRNPVAIAEAQEVLAGKATKVILMNADFRKLDTVLDAEGITTVDRILLDLGISSDELDASGRGFSFKKEEPLQMTMGDPASHPFTAGDIVNGWDEEDIANVIFAYGEERFARRIARAIVAYRAKTPIRTTTELAEVITLSVPGFYRRGKIHPATRTFQALRIAVNDELGALKEGLVKSISRLAPGGRLAVISFHSLEDRIVKEFFKEENQRSGATIISKKPLVAGPQEVAENPRSRSAKLRILQK
jgi:16S rRNA (cytosine1402-N4)-methyltransferase